MVYTRLQYIPGIIAADGPHQTAVYTWQNGSRWYTPDCSVYLAHAGSRWYAPDYSVYLAHVGSRWYTPDCSVYLSHR